MMLLEFIKKQIVEFDPPIHEFVNRFPIENLLVCKAMSHKHGISRQGVEDAPTSGTPRLVVVG